MQAIKVARHVLEQERRRTDSACLVTLVQKFCVAIRISCSIPIGSFHSLATVWHSGYCFQTDKVSIQAQRAPRKVRFIRAAPALGCTPSFKAGIP